MLPEAVLKPILENMLGKVLGNGNFQAQLLQFAGQWIEMVERQRRIETMLRTLLDAAIPAGGTNVRSVGYGGDGSSNPDTDANRSGVTL